MCFFVWPTMNCNLGNLLGDLSSLFEGSLITYEFHYVSDFFFCDNQIHSCIWILFHTFHIEISNQSEQHFCGLSNGIFLNKPFHKGHI